MPTQSSDRDPGDVSPAGIAFRPALVAAGAGVWDYDAGADRLCYCRSAARVLDLPAEAGSDGLPLARVGAHVHPDDRASCLAQFAGRREGGVAVAFRTAPVNGQSRDVLLRGRFGTQDGRPPHARGIVVDLSRDAASGAGGPADASALTALLASVDLVLAARRAMLALAPPDRADATAAADDLLMVLGRQLAATLPSPAEAR